MDIEIGGETFHKEPNFLEQIAYRDIWAAARIASLLQSGLTLRVNSDGVLQRRHPSAQQVLAPWTTLFHSRF